VLVRGARVRVDDDAVVAGSPRRARDREVPERLDADDRDVAIGRRSASSTALTLPAP
jgi:hypothetical protein